VVKSNVVYIYLVNLLIIKRLLNFKSLVNVTTAKIVKEPFLINNAVKGLPALMRQKKR